MKGEMCFWPGCGKPAATTINVGDEAGVALRHVCADCLRDRFEAE